MATPASPPEFNSHIKKSNDFPGQGTFCSLCRAAAGVHKGTGTGLGAALLPSPSTPCLAPRCPSDAEVGARGAAQAGPGEQTDRGKAAEDEVRWKEETKKTFVGETNPKVSEQSSGDDAGCSAHTS